MDCLRNIAYRWFPSIFKIEEAKQEKLKEQIKFIQSIVEAKDRMNEHLVQGLKARKLEYDLLGSKYQTALGILSQYIEKYGRIQGEETETQDDREAAGGAKGGQGTQA